MKSASRTRLAYLPPGSPAIGNYPKMTIEALDTIMGGSEFL
jgi:hypothetical protein